MVEFEKLGTPTVMLTTTDFVGLALASAKGFGMDNLAHVVLPHPLGGIPPAEAQTKAEAAFDEIVSAATRWDKKPAAATGKGETRTIKVTGDVEDVNRLLYQNGWTDGLPVIPPTVERVKKMLSGTSMSPDEVLGVVPPRMGIATVEIVAANAVMAGCRPEYLPVVIAAVQAALDPQFDLRAMTTTTNPCAPLIIVSGPIAKEIGLASGAGSLGPGFEANASIGRALNMVLDNVGGSKAPDPDKSTLGWPASFTMCLVENEEQSPWEPLRVELGYSKEDSTVTLLAARGFVNCNLHEADNAAGLLDAISDSIANVAENLDYCRTDSTSITVVLSPEHAATIAGDKFSKQDVKRYIFEAARVPLYKLRALKFPNKPLESCLCRADEHSLVPLVYSPDNILVVVSGGPGKHSVYMPTPRYGPVTKKVLR